MDQRGNSQHDERDAKRCDGYGERKRRRIPAGDLLCSLGDAARPRFSWSAHHLFRWHNARRLHVHKERFLNRRRHRHGVEAIIINAPSSNKNANPARDPEMHQTKKG
jgi:hypothetical protein